MPNTTSHAWALQQGDRFLDPATGRVRTVTRIEVQEKCIKVHSTSKGSTGEGTHNFGRGETLEKPGELYTLTSTSATRTQILAEDVSYLRGLSMLLDFVGNLDGDLEESGTGTWNFTSPQLTTGLRINLMRS